ncbi:MAG: DUF952 domain-containing protein [Eubacteriales bacterium]
MKKTTWDERKNKDCWGRRDLEAQGFIHCSTVEYFWRVAPNFSDVKDELVLVCIDENKLNPEVKYEDADNCGRAYPHVYGLINSDAIIKVLPFLKNKNGTYIKNPEFAGVTDE